MPDPIAVAAPTPIVTPWYLDKALYAKVLLPVITMGTAYLNTKLPIPLDPTTMAVLVGGFCASSVGYIVMHKWKTGMLQAATIATQAGKDAAAKVTTADEAEAAAAART